MNRFIGWVADHLWQIVVVYWIIAFVAVLLPEPIFLVVMVSTFVPAYLVLFYMIWKIRSGKNGPDQS